MNQNKTGLIILITCILASLLLFGCKNIAYNRVATDTKVSDRNKKLLLGVCDKNFPQLPPQYIKGETDTLINEVVKSDTVYSKDTVYITHTNTVIKTIQRTDTLKLTNTFHEIQLVEQSREKDKQIDKLTNENETLKANEKQLTRDKWKGWGAFAGLLALIGILYGLKIYLTKRP